MKTLRYLKFAEAAATFSKDPSTKVGAVAIDDNFNIIATGYNGPPRGVKDLPERLIRPTKYFFASHAESNLVAQAAYLGHSLKGATVLLTPLFPCTHCCKMLIQSGVKRVICAYTPSDRWTEEASYSKIMFDESGVEVLYVKKVNKSGGETIWETCSAPS